MAMIPVPNGSFETGDFSEWEVLQGNPSQINVAPDDRAPYDGTYGLAVRSNGEIVVRNTNYLDVIPGDVLNVSCMMMPTRGSDRGTVRVWWYDENDAPISPPYVEAPHNTPGHVAGTGGYRKSFLNNLVVPSNARRMRVGFYARKYTESAFGVDYFLVESTQDRTITLVAPPDGSEWEEGSTIQLRANVGGTRPAVQRVEYFVNNVSVGSVTSSPWALNYLNAPTGTHEVFARLHYGSGATLDSDVNTFIVEEELPPPDTREYNASNAYTQLVLENFAGLGSQIPSTAQITGLEVMVDYKLSVLSRTKDLTIDDPANANDLAPFDLVPQAALEVVMINNDGDRSVVGSPETVVLPIDRADFDIVETGISDGKKWTVRESAALYSASVGGEDILWGSDVIAFPDFVTRSLGVRFVLQPGSKPAYADAGDAVFRFFIDRIRIRAHFDAGSVEYYFASPNKDQIIKGTLVAGNVLSGNLRTGDAGGILQLLPELEVIDGDQRWIGNDWTIHSAYPPTDLNKIGDVGNIEGEDAVGMEYNSLPTQHQIRENRSRYQMISANFYGDKGLISIYGANGLSRAFAHNGEWFYKIYTQPDPEKDRPRHVAYHHWHLALGYEEGRVDISVVGEPYNFDGALGASSWTIGDQVVGLLPLSGTILGVFGGKSIWGISGTTVDNFATQVISPNIGATEYTITDMGFPVYANAYGIYTLSQTQEYGDYLGTPMSQDVSPWLRPRLVRKYTSDREVEVAWPVRSKNQYRLAFSDGYILSMTMNGQAIPTFSKQKYFMMPQEIGEECEIRYDYESIVPAAVSSQLDTTGEERIHIAPYIDPPEPEPIPEERMVVNLVHMYPSWGG